MYIIALAKQIVFITAPITAILVFFIGNLIYQLIISLFLYKFDIESNKKDIRYSLYWSTLVTTVFYAVCFFLAKAKLIDIAAWMGLSADATSFNAKSLLQYSLPAGLPLAVLQSLLGYYVFGRMAETNKGKKVLLSYVFTGLIFWAVSVLLQLLPLLLKK